MTDVDLVLLAIIAISALLGLWRGLIRVLVSLAAWLLGGIAAFVFGADVAQLFAGAADPRPVHLLAGYGASFVGVFLIVVAIGWVVRRLVQSIGLSGVDRVLGLAFGILRGGLIACLLVVVMGFTSVSQRPGWRDSQLLPLLLPSAQWVGARLPDWSALPIAPADAIRDIDLKGVDLSGVDLSGVDLNSVDLNRNILNGVGLDGGSLDGESLDGESLNDRDARDGDSNRPDSSSGDLNSDDLNSDDLNSHDARGGKPHSSNNGDAPALPQPGG